MAPLSDAITLTAVPNLPTDAQDVNAQARSGRATLHRVPGGAHLQRVEPIQTIGETPQLTAVFPGGRSVPLIASEKDQKEQQAKVDELTRLTKEIWGKVNDATALPLGSYDLRIRLSQRIVAISYKDADGVTRFLSRDPHDQAFYDAANRVKTLAQGFWKSLRTSDVESNRASTSGRAHLEIVSKGWQAHQPRSLNEYLNGKKKLGFGPLYDKLIAGAGRERGDEALGRIVGAEQFIVELSRQLDALAARKRALIEAADASPATQERETKELKEILDFRATLNQIDRNAIYAAVAVWGDPNVELDAPARFNKADELSVKMKEILTAQVPDTRTRFQKFRGVPREDLRSPIEEYAREAGDLLLHHPLEQLARAEKDNRVVKKASLEEFIVYHRTHRLDDAGIQESLRALGIRLSSETREALQSCIVEATQKAENIVDGIDALNLHGEAGWQKRVEAMRREEALRPLFQEEGR